LQFLKLTRKGIIMATKKFSLLLLGALAFVCAPFSGAAEPQAPDQVHAALRILASVYADMDSKLTNGQFDRLPHENQEFQDGSGAMRDAIANEPAEVKAKVQRALDKTLSAAQSVADTSKTHDAAKVRASIDALAASMSTLNALFPVALRAEPGSMPAPQHRGAP
jgi:hypothetical protein